MKRSIDWFRVALITALGVLLIVMFTSLGRLPGAWVIPSATGGELEATWTKPETNCDGTPVTNLAGFRAYWGPFKSELADPTASAYRVTGLPPGQWWIGVTAYNTDGTESPVAGPVVKEIAAADFTVTDGAVYTVVKRRNRFLLLSVGKVPMGTVCLASETVNGHYAVPVESVQWLGPRQDVVVAKCQ